MARFDPASLDAGYDPLLRINLRQQDEGGAPLAVVAAVWRGGHALPQRELLVLIHGYNNHRQEAEEAYTGFRVRQATQLADPTAKSMFQDLLGDTFWPGDAKWPGLVDKLDFFFYSKAVPVARDVAPTIADYLRQRDDVLTVHFLAHSLGCRVTLEVIKSLAQGGGPKVGKVCLMAAAVPTFKVCPGGSLYDAVMKASELRVLFSPADPVLGGAFPAGQTIASGDEGFFPSAVGLNGDIPIMSGKVDRDHIDGARHGEYWGYTKGYSTELSTKSIFEFFRFDGVSQRTLGERSLPASRPDVPSRQIGGLDQG